jgi:hypothetical protein
MQFTPANRNDIAKYYMHTFVKFKEHAIEKQLNPDTLFLIEAVDHQKVSGKCETGDQFVIWLSETYPFEADYVLPHKSFFQLGDNAVLLERIPAQQYYRGLSPENTQMTYLAGAAVAPKKLPIEFDSLKSFVTKQSFYSLEGAIGADKINTCVLSPRMQYNRHTNFIYVDHIPVARVPNGGKVIHMIKNIFREEVEELLAAHGEEKRFSFTDKVAEKQVAATEVQL